MDETHGRSPASRYLSKALENLADAKAALASGRNNACASRCYYSAFQAAVAALWLAGIRPTRADEGMLSHRMVQSEWAGRLVYRRKLYPPELQSTLSDLMTLRLRADYEVHDVTARQARHAVSISERLVQHVRGRGTASVDRERGTGGAEAT